MFTTSDPLELINEFVNTGQANFHQWPTVYLKFPKSFFLGIWGSETKIALFLGNEQAVRNAIVGSVEACLTSLTFFEPVVQPNVNWKVANIVKIFDWYCLDAAKQTLVYEDETGKQARHFPTEQPVTERLVWRAPGLESYSAFQNLT